MFEDVSQQFRQSLDRLDIFPVRDGEGYFVYLRRDGSIVESDRIVYTINGYRWGADPVDRRFPCKSASDVKVGVRFRNNTNHIYLTEK